MNKSSIRKKLIPTVVMLTLALGAAVPALAQTVPPTPEEEPAEPEPKTEPQQEPRPEPKTEAQTGSGDGIRGSITSISEAVVLVEEDPTNESGSPKGAFTVTGETDIL